MNVDGKFVWSNDNMLDFSWFHDFHISPMFMTSEHSLYFIGADWPWFLSTSPGYEGGKMMNMTGTWSLRFWKREGEWRSISIYITYNLCSVSYVSYVHILFYICFSMRIYIYEYDYHVYCYIYRWNICKYKCIYTYI